MSWNALRCAAATLAAAFSPFTLAAPGVLWEQTHSVEMEGMAMPGRTTKVCVPEGGTPEPSAGPDGNCAVKEVHRSGSRMTWKVVCTGKEAMTGEGDMTFGPDSWKGTVSMKSADGSMKMALRGRKLGGRCETGSATAGPADPRVADARRQAEAALAQANVATCDAAVASLDVAHLTGKDALCTDASALRRLCDRIATREGFTELGSRPEAVRRRTLETCKVDAEAARRRLCKASMDEAPAKDAVDFLDRCPDEVDRLAKRECAGRDFSGLDREWVPFCSRYASALMQKEAAKKEAKDGAVKAGKKALRGLFGF